VPNPRFKGTSQAGVRGDTIHSFDWTVGQVLATLDRLNLAGNTLVIVTSDNGGVLDANGPDTEHGGTRETNNGHLHNGPLRAGKGSAYEGGTRVPFIVRWPGRIKPGVSDALICHMDMLATMAALTGQKLADAAGPDSFNVLPALLGARLDKPCRDHLVEHGNVLAIRKGPWKLIPANPPVAAGKKNKKRDGPGDQLYNLDEDIGETNNVAAAHPDLVKEMTELLQRIRENGRSRP
jgi:arylsulfatase A-like enzyme